MFGNAENLVILSFFRLCSLLFEQVLGDCNVASIQVPNSTVSGGQYYDTVGNLPDCEDLCATTPSCVGLDWDINSNSCFLIFENNTNAINYGQASDVDHYYELKSTNNCIGNCSYSVWLPAVNQHSWGASSASPQTLTDCVALCIDDVTCTGIDWDTKNNSGFSCWIYTQTNLGLGPAAGIYHYDKTCVPVPAQQLSASTSLATTMITTIPNHQTLLTSTTLPTTTTINRLTLLSSLLSSSKTTSSSTTTTAKPLTGAYTLLATSYGTSLGTSYGTSLWTLLPTGFAGTGTVLLTVPNSSSGISTTSTVNPTSTTTNSYIEGSDDLYVPIPLSIKPSYVVLAGLGGGCILLVITAVCVLCQYPLNRDEPGEEYKIFNNPTPNTSSGNTTINMQMFDADPALQSAGVAANEFQAAVLVY